MANKRLLLALVASLGLSACGDTTVRDTVDWIPGVDSKEEVAAKEQAEREAEAKKAYDEYRTRTAYAPVTTTAPSEMDTQIQVAVNQAFSGDDSVDATSIGVAVNSGVVTLNGTAASEAEAIRAVNLVKQVSGVRNVISRLVIISVRETE